MKLRAHTLFLALAFVTAIPTTAFAQDQIHYLPPVYSRSTTSTNSLPATLELVLTTNETTAFDVFCETGDGTALTGSPFNVVENGPAVVTLGSYPASAYAGFVSGAGSLNTVLAAAGVKCAASAAFFTNVRTISQDAAQAASLTGKGRVGLGTDFRTGHFKAQGSIQNNNLKAHFASVMATEDNTTVNITEIKSGVVFQGTTTSGTPATSDAISVVLNAGESYVVAHHFSNTVAGTDDVNGTRITSDKPIAVTSGSWLGGAKSGNGGRDIAVDQTIPSVRLRDSYVLFRGATTTSEPGEDINLERPLVVAVEGNTDIYVNGSLLPSNPAPLDAGGYHFLTHGEFDGNTLMFVELRDSVTGLPKPGYMYQSTNAALNGNGPTMGVVPAVPCVSARRVEIQDVSYFGNHVLQIVARAGATVNVADSNGPVTLPAAINPTGTTAWDTYRLTGLAAGGVQVDADVQFFVTLASEQSNRGVQATYTGFADAPLIIDPLALSTSTIIYPVLLTLEQSLGVIPGTYQWYRDGVVLVGENSDTLLATGPGTYTVTGTTAECGTTPLSTEVFLPGELELSKQVVSVTQATDSTYAITYRFTAENYTANTLSGVQIADDLQAALAPLVPGTHWSITGAPTASGDFAAGDLNGSFDGLTAGDANLLAAGVDLASRERGSIELTVTVDILGGLPTGDNVATITEGTGTFTDVARQPYPHPDPLNVTAALTNVTNVAGDTWDLDYTVTVTNETATLATNVQLLADLELALAPLTLADWTILVPPATSGAFTGGDANGAFDGQTAGVLEMLGAGVQLAPGATGTITFTIQIDVSGAVPTASLSVIGSADGFPTDLSDDAFGPGHFSVDGPDADADPTNDPTPVSVDTDGDGTSDYTDTDDDNDGIPDATDPARTNPDICGDSDSDSCDDCTVGTDDFDVLSDSLPNNDGTDTDSDGLCDAGDPDDDGDGVDDPDDTAPLDPNVCRDVDSDNCDDCTSGTSDTANDGPDGDGDGICDAGEDTDGDGIVDVNDLDDDNDGIPDTMENALAIVPDGDADGDGVFNYLDADNRGDGSPQTCVEAPVGVCSSPGTDFDRDGDGVANHLDLDADGDGIPDVVEAGHDAVDTSGSGTVDCTGGVGTNGLCDELETTADSGIADFDSSGAGPDAARNTDSDALPDFLDIDSDSDGVTDLVEGGSGCVDTTPADNRCDGPDGDGDGISDGLDGTNGFGDDAYTAPTDTDNDMLPDYRSLDADGDTIPDVVEAASACVDAAPADDRCDGPDADGDGLADDANATTPNKDGDTQPDYQDIDSDNDGIADSVEGTGDPDGDGLPNYLDLDSDNDGILDVTEGDSACVDTTPRDGACDGPDADGDGLADDASGVAPPDTDGDGAADFVDLDSDNDGASDVTEGASGCADTTPADAVCDGPDADNDGVADDVTIQDAPDTDSDGVPDFRDLDTDNDGIVDVIEVGSGCADADENAVCDGPDGDGDGIPDSIDDAATFGDPTVTVPTNTDSTGSPDFQDLDSDDDGTPDVDGSNCTDTTPQDDRCDGPDTDGDGAVDEIDGFDGFGVSRDTDGDGIADAIDLDDDNDGIPDTDEGAGDTDGDGTPDAVDLDSDNDGIPDVVEAGHGGTDSNGDGTLDCAGGVGANGLCDSVETSADSGTLNYTVIDTDGDGVRDFQDLDSDNDGIVDLFEGSSGCTDTTPADAVCDGPDSDGDGVVDSVDSTDGFGIGGYGAPPDTDSDGTPDYRDLESDGDGIDDVDEGGHGDLDGNNDGVVDGSDSDGDGVIDGADGSDTFGITGVTPPTDTDGDGTPDYRDLDSDDDSISDDDEGGEPGEDPPDTDGDGDPDYQDTDSDGDTVADGTDNCRLNPNTGQEDEDGDGMGQACDTDDNGDGFDDDIGISGGGCSAGPSNGAGAGMLALMLGLLVATRRRRRSVSSTTQGRKG